MPKPTRNGQPLRVGTEQNGREAPRASPLASGSAKKSVVAAHSLDGPFVGSNPISERRQAETVGTWVLGYASVSGEREELDKRELSRQVDEIALECQRRGLRLLEVVRERERNPRRVTRPGLEYALGRIAAGEASGLVVAELYRMTRSVPELGRVLEWLSRHDARIVSVAPGLDSDEEAGRLAVRTIVEIARWERRRLVERTRNGMRAARRSGPASVADFPKLRRRIAAMRARGMTLQAIADTLNVDGVPTIRGGSTWRPSSVQVAVGYQRPATGRILAPQDEDPGESVAVG